jgi:hypothetical protein
VGRPSQTRKPRLAPPVWIRQAVENKLQIQINLWQELNGIRLSHHSAASIGDLIYFTRGGKQFVKAKRVPDPDREAEEGERKNQGGFRQAVIYAKGVIRNPEQKAAYEPVARAEGTNAYQRAISDARNKPVFLQLDASAYTGATGQPIAIQAQDDFEVTQVLVKIQDPSGATLEEGAAAQVAKGSKEWVYKTTAAVPEALAGFVLCATVIDRPMNRVEGRVEHLLKRGV